MLTVGLPAGSVGTVPVTVIGKTRLVPILGSAPMVLVGGVVSISQEVGIVPMPGLPYWS